MELTPQEAALYHEAQKEPLCKNGGGRHIIMGEDINLETGVGHCVYCGEEHTLSPEQLDKLRERVDG